MAKCRITAHIRQYTNCRIVIKIYSSCQKVFMFYLFFCHLKCKLAKVLKSYFTLLRFVAVMYLYLPFRLIPSINKLTNAIIENTLSSRGHDRWNINRRISGAVHVGHICANNDGRNVSNNNNNCLKYLVMARERQ